MTFQRILAVDDDEAALKVVEYVLAQEGYTVHTAPDAATAERILSQVSMDLVILDVMLPDKSGLEIARELRARSSVPIIILSARDGEVDRVLGLELGADDYITKPFSPRELASRVKTILRRASAGCDEKTLLVVGELTIDTNARQAKLGERPIDLTLSEYGILLHFAKHPGTAFSREAILAALRGDLVVGDERAVDVHIHNIREKLEPDPENPAYILTVRGFGYRFRES